LIPGAASIFIYFSFLLRILRQTFKYRYQNGQWHNRPPTVQRVGSKIIWQWVPAPRPSRWRIPAFIRNLRASWVVLRGSSVRSSISQVTFRYCTFKCICRIIFKNYK